MSFTDQCFKGLIPVRHFDRTDMKSDMAGYVAGCFVGWVSRKIKGEFKGCISKGNIVG